MTHQHGKILDLRSGNIRIEFWPEKIFEFWVLEKVNEMQLKTFVT